MKNTKSTGKQIKQAAAEIEKQVFGGHNRYNPYHISHVLLAHGNPKIKMFDDEDDRQHIESERYYIGKILETVNNVLDKCPKEMHGDILQRVYDGIPDYKLMLLQERYKEDNEQIALDQWNVLIQDKGPDEIRALIAKVKKLDKAA